ncbi:hypothetical protein BJ508DRAFT_367810 [Ascobolus immersus RN42]|uniref:DUF7029 domain-containing protein n=1 Tax=Ascobolus immersus RN42 TaxID=1160509 RepID=A0A3N4HDH4_ASCIM|nr:hypothetical protein BJ508DRAFT_367810 [Ascobolus immersus RN42]
MPSVWLKFSLLLLTSLAAALPQSDISSGTTVEYNEPSVHVDGLFTTKVFTPKDTTGTSTLEVYRSSATNSPNAHLSGKIEPVEGDPFGFHEPKEHKKGSKWKPKHKFEDFIDKKKARLKPIVDVRYNPRDKGNLKPGKNLHFPYVSEETDDDTIVAADLAFNFNEDTVVLERFFELVDDLTCNAASGVMKMTFVDTDALNTAVAEWPVEDGFNIVAPLTGANCDDGSQRGVYRAWISSSKAKTLTLKYEMKTWKDVSAGMTMDFGQLRYEKGETVLETRDLFNRSIQKRGLFSKIKAALKKVVDAVTGTVDKIIDKLSNINWDPSVSFGVSLGPFGSDSSPFGTALRLYDSSNGGWPKGFTWQQLNAMIETSYNLKKRDMMELSTEERLKLAANTELSRRGLSRVEKRALPSWVRAGAWCVDCFARANLMLSGHVTYNAINFELEEFTVTFSGNMEANVALGFMLSASGGASHSKEVIRAAVGPGIVIPEILSLGVTLPVTVALEANADLSFLTLVGANFAWPKMGVTIDIKDGGSTSYGWSPIITYTTPDITDLEVSAILEVSATVALEAGIKVFGDVVNEQAGVSATVSVGERITFNKPAESTCTGLGLVTYIGVSVSAYVSSLRTWSLWNKVWNIVDVCLFPGATGSNAMLSMKCVGELASGATKTYSHTATPASIGG